MGGLDRDGALGGGEAHGGTAEILLDGGEKKGRGRPSKKGQPAKKKQKRQVASPGSTVSGAGEESEGSGGSDSGGEQWVLDRLKPKVSEHSGKANKPGDGGMEAGLQRAVECWEAAGDKSGLLLVGRASDFSRGDVLVWAKAEPGGKKKQFWARKLGGVRVLGTGRGERMGPLKGGKTDALGDWEPRTEVGLATVAEVGYLAFAKDAGVLNEEWPLLEEEESEVDEEDEEEEELTSKSGKRAWDYEEEDDEEDGGVRKSGASSGSSLNRYYTLDGVIVESVWKKERGIGFVRALTPWVRLAGVDRVTKVLVDGTWEAGTRGESSDKVQTWFLSRAYNSAWSGGNEEEEVMEVELLLGTHAWRSSVVFRAFMLSDYGRVNHVFVLDNFVANPACMNLGREPTVEGRKHIAVALRGYIQFEALLRSEYVAEVLWPLVHDLERYYSQFRTVPDVVVLGLLEDMLVTWNNRLRMDMEVMHIKVGQGKGKKLGAVRMLTEWVAVCLHTPVQEGGQFAEYVSAVYFAEGGGYGRRCARLKELGQGRKAGGQGSGKASVSGKVSARVKETGVSVNSKLCLRHLLGLYGVKGTGGKTCVCTYGDKCSFIHRKRKEDYTKQECWAALDGGKRSVTGQERQAFTGLITKDA